MPLTIADDWPGAWDVVPWARPDDWRDVTGLLAWDVAVVGAGWVHFEAAHQTPERQRSIRVRLEILAQVLASDLPFLLGVGPTAPAGQSQPQLPLVLPDDPPLERLDERPQDMSWRMYFWMTLEQTLARTLQRAAHELRAESLQELGIPIPPGVDLAALTQEAYLALAPGREPWLRARADEERRLASQLCEQVALQIECILRDQLPTVLPLLEESIAVGVEDAALGGAIHVETDDDDRPVALRLVSHEGRPRAPVWIAASGGADLRELIDGVGFGVAPTRPAATGAVAG